MQHPSSGVIGLSFGLSFEGLCIRHPSGPSQSIECVSPGVYSFGEKTCLYRHTPTISFEQSSPGGQASNHRDSQTPQRLQFGSDTDFEGHTFVTPPEQETHRSGLKKDEPNVVANAKVGAIMSMDTPRTVTGISTTRTIGSSCCAMAQEPTRPAAAPPPSRTGPKLSCRQKRDV